MQGERATDSVSNPRPISPSAYGVGIQFQRLNFFQTFTFCRTPVRLKKYLKRGKVDEDLAIKKIQKFSPPISMFINMMHK